METGVPVMAPVNVCTAKGLSTFGLPMSNSKVKVRSWREISSQDLDALKSADHRLSELAEMVGRERLDALKAAAAS